jgi:hypothetical protein
MPMKVLLVMCNIHLQPTHDHFLLCRSKLNRDDIIALDRAYIDYAKFEEMTKRDTIYVTKMKKKLISLLTNDFEMTPEDIIDIYRKRWTIENLFKQLKQNFPLRYFYGESANAIKIQVWCTLIANLLLMVIKCSVRKSWSFSGLATMIRILMMYYVNYKSILEYPEKDWDVMIEEVIRPPNHPSLFD